MPVYGNRDSPKRAAAVHEQRRTEPRKRTINNKTACLWILVALLPFLVVKIVFSYTSPFFFPQSENRVADLISELPSPDFLSPDAVFRSGNEISGSSSAVSVSPKELKIPGSRKPPAASEEAKPPQISPKSSRLNGNELPPPEATSHGEEQELDSPEDNEKKEAQKWQAPIDEKEGEKAIKSRSHSAVAPRGSKECVLYDGDWVEDPEGPLYTNETCFYKHAQQDCMSNGRPDTSYLYWKWKPRNCELPRFDAKAFLVMFRCKTIAFVGDSLSRNQMQSLLCMLSQVEIPDEIYKSPDDKSVRWRFKTYQVTLATVWSPYLLKETAEELKGIGEGQSKLFMDTVDEVWTSVMNGFDVMVLSIGQWYLKPSIYIENDQIIGCHYCPERNLTEVGFLYAYRKGVHHVLDKVTKNYKGFAILTTLSLDHFENGSWSTGGSCRREHPFKKGEKVLEGINYDMYQVVMDEYRSTVERRKSDMKKLQLELLDITVLSLLRADGHPGPFRSYHPFDHKLGYTHVQNDCLHWCLPGPIDTWNQFLVEAILPHL
ncbi:hypothetical protein R1flu_026873 [Riccia fluitans]|uniref:Trichome birefringence-like N-terminal domain-containing protein n=1 Tax=Riccia fluitans TaxID=41844 RepID=A0ABD1XH56_9MARC